MGRSGPEGVGDQQSRLTLYPKPFYLGPFPQHGLLGLALAIGANLSSPIGQAGALHGIRGQTTPYPEQTSSLLLTSPGYSVGPAGPALVRIWL